MGLGYAVPYLGMFRGEAARLGALMPASQGAVAWPASGNGHTVMVEEAMLPLPDASVDRLLACIAWRRPSAPARCCARCGACWPPRGACC